MDRSSNKRGAVGLVAPRKAYSVTALKDAATTRDQNAAQFCNRIGCSGRVKCIQNARTGSSDKSKCSKPSCSSNGTETIEKSFSRSSSLMTSAKKSSPDSKRKMSPQPKSDPSESGHEAEQTSKPKEVSMRKTGSSSVSSNIAPRKIFHQKPVLRNQNTPLALSVPSSSRSSPLGPYNRTRTGTRNLKCNSVTDDGRPSCPQLESESVGRKITEKRSSEGESSNLSRRGRRTTPPSPIDRHTSPSSSSGISISDSARSSSASREESSGTSSVWIRRSMNSNSRMRFSGPQNGRRNSSSAREPPISFSQIHDNERPFSGSRTYRLSSSHDDNPSSRMPLDGIAEVLLALERTEQDEELTHEQIFALETSLFLTGLNLYDQHRDMRLDIDSMSYEELLALGERMGTVSTALSEEALSKCLTRSIYQSSTSHVQITGSSGEDADDTKCSVCQEEYVNGDEIAKLVECQHGYHARCINQWLQLKNWCPICKASAEPSQSSSSL